MKHRRRPTAPDAPRPQGRRHGRRPRRRVLRRLALCVCVLLLCTAGAGWYFYRDLAGQIGSSRALGDGAPKSSGGATNILLMGLDSRKDRNGDALPKDVLAKLHAGASSDIGGYNTNTLILLHVPADGGRATAFSIPRDDLVDIPGHGKDKIKKAYGLAKAAAEDRLARQGVADHDRLEHEGREAGRRAEIETVRTFLGVPIDHFAEVNLVGFLHIADALDGVPVCLKHPVKDRYSGADFPAGRQTLDGPQSLAFVRQRHGLPAGDLDRTRRQQAFLASATHKLNSVGTFTDPLRLLKLMDVAKQDLVIDDGWDLLSFVEQAKNLSGGNVRFSTLPVEGFAKHRGEDVNLVDPEKIRRLVARETGAAHGGSAAPGASAGSGDTSGTSSAAPRSPAGTLQPSPSSSPSAVESGSGAGGSGQTAPMIDGGGIPCVD
ncbi:MULTISPECIES: LCP family protein [Streptomyces]|uniref:LCP family protein n=1 Tax=Streptomyces TaxID=1883 RepID=UPI00067C89D8|nr:MULTISPECIES: LCP family protein [Streptomyces]KOT51575.1 LytR family transcriptional regulator [Streptomyces rimosus subsp. rimosus]